MDNVYLVVDYDYVQGLSRDLECTLHQAVMTGDSNERCQKLLQDAPNIFARREELQRRLERLEAAKAELAFA